MSGSKSGGSSAIISSNGRVVNPFQSTKPPQPQPPGPVTVPHSNSDLNSRKMVVLQEYRPTDNQGLPVKRGEVVQVSRIGGWGEGIQQCQAVEGVQVRVGGRMLGLKDHTIKKQLLCVAI